MNADPLTRRAGFRPDVEALRGIAILGVVAYHAGIPGFSGGYVGVDVFFVLSGFLITQILLREWDQHESIDLWRFYARRMRRLLPASFVAILVPLVLAWLLLSPLELEVIGRSARSAAAYLSNLRFARQATDYLAHSARNDPFLHTWSLSVEEQFYLLWPVFLVLLFRVFGKRDRILAVAIALTSAISFALCVYLTKRAQPWAFFMVAARWWEFGIGGLVAIAAPRIADLVARRDALLVPALCAVILPFVLYGSDTAFPGITAAVPVLGTAALLLAGAGQGAVAALLRGRLLQRLGALSYSWYLWHWPVLFFSWVLFPEIPLAGRVAAALVALCIAYASHVLVENPLRYAPLRISARRVVGAGLAATAVAAALSSIAVRGAANASELAPHRAYRAAVTDLPLVYLNGCMRNTMDRDLGQSCVFGEERSPTRVVLFGDSHAAHWFPALERIARERRWALHVLVKTSCPAPDVVVYLPSLRRAYDECTEWRQRAIAEIRSMHPALVMVASSNLYLEADALEGNPVAPSAWEGGLARTIAAISGGADRVAIMRDNPHPGFDVPVCHARRSWSPLWQRDCTFALEKAMARQAVRAEEAALARLAGVELLDLKDAICPGATCPTIRGDTVLYRDDNHLTPAFSYALAPALGAMLDGHLADVARGQGHPPMLTAGP